MGQYRDLMDREMRIRGFSEQTCRAYLGWMRRFVEFVGRPVPQISLEDVHRYQFHVTRDRRAARSTSDQLSCALRFFFGVTLKKGWDIKDIPYQRTARKLPVILSTRFHKFV
jgi:site-specific recombinase XerD